MADSIVSSIVSDVVSQLAKLLIEEAAFLHGNSRIKAVGKLPMRANFPGTVSPASLIAVSIPSMTTIPRARRKMRTSTA